MTDVRCGAQEPHANEINHDSGSETEVPHTVKRNRIKSLWNLLAMVKRKGTALAERSPQPYNCIPGKNDSTVTLNSTKRRNLAAEDPQEDQPEILRRRSPRLYNYSSATSQDPGIPFDSPPQRRSINKGKGPAQPSRDEDQGGVPLQNSAYEQAQKSNSPQDIHDEPPTYNTGSSSKAIAPGLTENGKRRHASVKPQHGLDGFRCDCSNSTDKPHGTSDSCGAQEATVQEYMKRAPKLEDQGEPLGAVHDHRERASNPADQEERNSTRKARKGRETDPWFSAVLGSSSRPIDLCSSSSSPQDSGSGSASASNAAFLIAGTSNTTATSQSQTIATEATWLGYWMPVEEEKAHHCVICMEDLPAESFSIVRITNKCEHFQDACKECVAASISAQFESKMWDQLKCPLCPELLSHEEIQEHASPAIFEKYDNLAATQCISSLPDYWECPNPSCTFAGYLPQQDPTEAINPLTLQIQCNSCLHFFCSACKVPWHAHLTCAQFKEKEELENARNKEKVAEEEKAEEMLMKTTKPCPGNNCGVRIEKNQGCHHMRCTKCLHQFCWDCLAPWSSIIEAGNDAHGRECRWHTDNTRSRPVDAQFAAYVTRVHDRR